MLILIVISTIFRIGMAEDERNVTILEALFKKRHMSDAGYSEWKELHDANTTMLERVCEKYVFMISSATDVAARTEKKFRDRYPFSTYSVPIVELDTLTCNLTLLGRKGDVKGEQVFYLADGDEPNSAFKFAILKTNGGLFLTRKVTDVWT